MYSTKAMLLELVDSICSGCVLVYKDWLFSFIRHQPWMYNIFVPQAVFVSKPINRVEDREAHSNAP
jgi:hypothetical protein